MARFTARGRLFNGGSNSSSVVAASCGSLRSIDVSPILVPIPPNLHKRKLLSFNCTRNSRVCVSRSSPSSSGSHEYKQLKNKEEISNAGDDAILEELLEDYEDEMDDLSCFRGLVLDNAYRPINVVCWKRAICLEFMEKADVLEYYDQTVNSLDRSFYIPAVLRVHHLLQFKRRRIRRPITRGSILSRDDYTCQYCSSQDRLTIDHIVPASQGGEWTWENLVTACHSCNSKKGHKSLAEANMQLLKTPKPPKAYEILALPLTRAASRMLIRTKKMPNEWQQYLSKPFP